MTQTFILIFFTSLWTLGVYFATYEGMILHDAKQYTEKIFGEYWSKPILGCPYCMPSLHGIFIVGVFHLKHYQFCIHPWPWLILQWAIVFVSSSALNNLLFNLIEVVRGYADLFNQPAAEEKPPCGCAEVKDIVVEVKQN